MSRILWPGFDQCEPTGVPSPLSQEGGALEGSLEYSISLRCSLQRSLKGRCVSPTYCKPQIVHDSKYIKLLLSQSTFCLTVYIRPVLWLLIFSTLWNKEQYLQLDLLHLGFLTEWSDVGLGVLSLGNLALTRWSAKFLFLRHPCLIFKSDKCFQYWEDSKIE